MARDKLDNLVEIRQLSVGDATEAEIGNLTERGLKKLRDSKRADLDPESQFDLVYNAAHALSLAALRFAGYRSENRYTVFQCMQHTIDLEPEFWRVLDSAHKDRNIAEYEGDIIVDAQLVAALIRVTDIIAERVQRLVK
jgi:hypothetical protein